MESIQEAFLLLDQSAESLGQLHQYALIFHSINLFKGLNCTGFQEDDPASTESKNSILNQELGIVKLPENWID